MALIIPEGYAQTIIRLEDASFTDGYALITGGVVLDGATLEGMASRIASFLPTWALTDRLSAGTLIAEVTVQNAMEAHTEEVGQLGGNTAAMPPVNTAVLVKKTTSRRGPRGQGRNFWPNICAEADMGNSGVMTEPMRDELQGYFDNYLNLGVQGDRPHVILQNAGGQSPAITPPPLVTSFVVDQQVATQRRRMRR